MSRDKAIESWLASMNESELIDQCFFWHDTALEQGRMYNAVKAENAKLRELVRDMHRYFHLVKVDGLCQWGPRIMRRIRDLGIEVDE